MAWWKLYAAVFDHVLLALCKCSPPLLSSPSIVLTEGDAGTELCDWWFGDWRVSFREIFSPISLLLYIDCCGVRCILSFSGIKREVTVWSPTAAIATVFADESFHWWLYFPLLSLTIILVASLLHAPVMFR